MATLYFSVVVAEQVKRNGAVRGRISDGHKIRRIAGLLLDLDKALLGADSKGYFVSVSVNKHDDRPVTVTAHRNGIEEVVEFPRIR